MYKKYSFFAIIVGLTLFGVQAKAVTLATWEYSRSITITSDTSIVPGTQTDFPMLVDIPNSTYLQPTLAGGRLENANGYDVMFSSAADCSAPLNFETELYSSSTGEFVAWVNVPSLSADSVIYMCYGNPGITTSQGNPAGTWGSDYEGVWHLSSNGDATQNASDSTLNVNNGTAVTATPVLGEIGSGSSLGAGGISVPDASSLEPSNITVEGWVKSAGTPNSFSYIIGKPLDPVQGDSYALYTGPNGNIYFYVMDSTLNLTRTPDVTTPNVWDGNWHDIAGTWDGTTANIYIDGSLVASTSSPRTIAYAPSNLYMGTFDGTNFPANINFDEARISDNARPSDWIATEYKNENSPSTFYTVGDEVAITHTTNTDNPDNTDNSDTSDMTTPPSSPVSSAPVSFGSVGVAPQHGLSGFVSVTIQSPYDGSSASGTITLAGNTTDNNQVKSFYFTVDGTQAGDSLPAAPYTTTFDTTALSSGSHTVQAFAVNQYGDKAASTPITIVTGGGEVLGASTTIVTASSAPEILNDLLGQLFSILSLLMQRI